MKKKKQKCIFITNIKFDSRGMQVFSCLTTLFHNEDAQCCPPPLSRLGTGTVKLQDSACRPGSRHIQAKQARPAAQSSTFFQKRHFKDHNILHYFQIEVTIICSSFGEKQFRIKSQISAHKSFQKRRESRLGSAYKRREGPRVSIRVSLVIRKKLNETSTPRQITNLQSSALQANSG